MIGIDRDRQTRTRLEEAVVRASVRVEALAEAATEREAIREAQDELSGTAAALARYLLATGETGWLRARGRRRQSEPAFMNLGPVGLQFPAGGSAH